MPEGSGNALVHPIYGAGNQSALARDSADDRELVGDARAFQRLAVVPVLILPAHLGLIHFHDADQLADTLTLRRDTDKLGVPSKISTPRLVSICLMPAERVGWVTLQAAAARAK